MMNMTKGMILHSSVPHKRLLLHHYYPPNQASHYPARRIHHENREWEDAASAFFLTHSGLIGVEMSCINSFLLAINGNIIWLASSMIFSLSIHLCNTDLYVRQCVGRGKVSFYYLIHHSLLSLLANSIFRPFASTQMSLSGFSWWWCWDSKG